MYSVYNTSIIVSVLNIIKWTVKNYIGTREWWSSSAIYDDDDETACGDRCD
jgi:hypothetical protein